MFYCDCCPQNAFCASVAEPGTESGKDRRLHLLQQFTFVIGADHFVKAAGAVALPISRTFVSGVVFQTRYDLVACSASY